MNIAKFVGFALSLSFLSGCASLGSMTSGQIGCPEDQIKISDDKSGWTTRTWTAECQDKKYYCSAHGGGEGSTAQVACNPAQESETNTGGGDAGCSYDTQCKGERICVSGACVDP